MTRLPDDAPVHPSDVLADDAALEALRSRSAHLRPGDDLALLLVQELLRDVAGEDARPGAPALHVVGGAPPRVRPRRALRSGAVVAALAAGVLSVGGAAAAAAPEGSPLRGVGDAVRSVAGAVVDAVAPSRSSEPVTAEADGPAEAASTPEAAPAAPSVREPLPTAAATTAATARSAPGAAAAAARASSAERAVVSLLDSAARQLAAGRPGAAAGMLDTAERRLAEVVPARRRRPGREARCAARRGRRRAGRTGAGAGRPGRAHRPPTRAARPGGGARHRARHRAPHRDPCRARRRAAGAPYRPRAARSPRSRVRTLVAAARRSGARVG